MHIREEKSWLNQFRVRFVEIVGICNALLALAAAVAAAVFVKLLLCIFTAAELSPSNELPPE